VDVVTGELLRDCANVLHSGCASIRQVGNVVILVWWLICVLRAKAERPHTGAGQKRSTSKAICSFERVSGFSRSNISRLGRRDVKHLRGECEVVMEGFVCEVVMEGFVCTHHVGLPRSNRA
jgi:hypothetical protein